MNDLDNSVEAVARRMIHESSRSMAEEVTGLIIPAGDRDAYLAADILLARIRQAKIRAVQIFAEKIGDPILDPMRKALDKLYTLRREMTEEPFDGALALVKGKMAAWQAGETARREAERLATEAEERRKVREANKAREEAEQAARTARTATERKRAALLAEERFRKEGEAQRATEKAVLASQQKRVVGTGSRVIETIRAEVKECDLAKFVAAVAAGTIPFVCLRVNEEVLQAYWEQDRGVVRSWPGVTVVVETKVGGR